ncbi:MAG TPA: efflux RND transporter periplasmic adaptor subunit [Labilithrix sp.]|jgi:RND family efflux transporter MFP subunit
MTKDPNDDLGFSLPEARRLTPTRALAIGACAVFVLGAAFVAGWLPRHRERVSLEAETKDAQVTMPRVVVIKPKPLASDRAIVLPGSIQPLEETVIYPRASGYVRKWSVDIGEKVAEGALLAEIDTPELDQQLVQARAQLTQAEAGLVQAQANAAYSKTTSERYERLAPAGVASQQELDKEKAQAAVDVANVAVANANVAAQHANIERLLQLKGFGRVLAPFAGTVTARMIDRGALVTSGNGTPLFKLSATDPVRVFVQAPQDVATGVRVDTPAHVEVREFAGRVFEGKIAHAAGALDPATRTMLTEIRVPNPKGELLAGMYAQVALTLPTPHRVYEVPATALINDAKGVRVATVGPGNTIHLVPVAIERDTGAAVELASGLEGTERIVKLADVELTEGRVVDATP